MLSLIYYYSWALICFSQYSTHSELVLSWSPIAYFVRLFFVMAPEVLACLLACGYRGRVCPSLFPPLIRTRLNYSHIDTERYSPIVPFPNNIVFLVWLADLVVLRGSYRQRPEWQSLRSNLKAKEIEGRIIAPLVFLLKTTLMYRAASFKIKIY